MICTPKKAISCAFHASLGSIVVHLLRAETSPQEDRLRDEAAKRLERRRKKMLSPEERLARS